VDGNPFLSRLQITSFPRCKSPLPVSRPGSDCVHPVISPAGSTFSPLSLRSVQCWLTECTFQKSPSASSSYILRIVAKDLRYFLQCRPESQDPLGAARLRHWMLSLSSRVRLRLTLLRRRAREVSGWYLICPTFPSSDLASSVRVRRFDALSCGNGMLVVFVKMREDLGCAVPFESIDLDQIHLAPPPQTFEHLPKASLKSQHLMKTL